MKQNNDPLVSIIIVTYNADKWLEDCLKSIISQSYRNFEIVITDALSTDKTVDIIKRYDNDIAYWKSEADEGIYDAMNKSTKYCKGTWLYFLGSDDILMPGFSEQALKLKIKNTIYYGDCITTNERIFLGGKYNNYRLAKMNICHHAIFYPKNVFKNYSYEKKYIVSADHVLNIKLWADKRYTWKYYPITIAKFSLNGFSTQTKDPEFKQDCELIIKKYLGWFAYLRFKIKRFKERNNPKNYYN